MEALATYKTTTYQYDPTRTGGLRQRFTADMRRRFKALTAAIVTGVWKNDCFGLNQPQVYQLSVPAAGAFAFARDDAKLRAFKVWLDEQIKKGILTVGEIEQLGTSIDSMWTNQYIVDSYKRGLLRAGYEMRRAGVPVPDVTSAEAMFAMMSLPVHLERLGVIFTRVYSDLKGITDAMDMQISRVLAQGLADGDGPRLLARKLVSTINGTGTGDLAITDTVGRFIPAQRRAEMLARTEVIRAHHLGLVQMYRNYGVIDIQVQAEFRTIGDDRVCSKCAELHGEVFTLDEIEYMIPVHPNCRCFILPIIKELEEFNIK